MKLLSLFLLFSLDTAEPINGQENGEKIQRRKLSRKEFRQCKSENCSYSCPAGELKTPSCISCIQSACDLPKGLAFNIECMQTTCADNCDEDMLSENCTNCKKERCSKDGKNESKNESKNEQENRKKIQNRKLSRKEFRKCKSENCSDSCAAGELKTPSCISCIQSACDLPNGLAFSIECMQMACADNCTEDMYSENCTNCKKERCTKEGKADKGQKHAARKTAGRAPTQTPFAILDKYVCGKAKGCISLSNGAKAQHRCGIGMCHKKCIIEPINELDCEDCIRSLCPRASDNYSCINAERDSKYFFCSNAENCTGPHSGAVTVPHKSCPSGSFCCSWGE